MAGCIVRWAEIIKGIVQFFFCATVGWRKIKMTCKKYWIDCNSIHNFFFLQMNAFETYKGSKNKFENCFIVGSQKVSFA